MSETNKFLILNHETDHPHFDFYLQFEDQQLSWIIPNGIPTNKKEKKGVKHLFDNSTRLIYGHNIIKGNP